MKSMKKKINIYLVLTVFLTLTATLCMAVAVFHQMYQRQVINDMRIYTELIRNMGITGEELKNQVGNMDSELRVTFIDQNGSVKYDSRTEEENLDNHLDRPEIQSALESEEGYCVRHSDTLDRDMYYYAVRLSDGGILRISKEEASIWGVFTKTIYGIIGIAFLMFLVCFVFSMYMTNSIIHPVEQLAGNIASDTQLDTYKELQPFLKTIQRQHTDILKSANIRQEFTANVSHELKTPLTAISGYAELIETGLAGENEVRRFAKEIHRSSKRLLTLINDIIRLSELDSDHLQLSLSEVDLYSLAQNCVETLKVNANSHGIKIASHGEKAIVHADVGMMEELLFNLCDNAIRYNRLGGRVDVSVERQENQTVLSVKDTGIGIPEESQERIFERFYRVDKSRSKLTGGTGLGLAIVKHIVAQHHARLELQSEVGTGTEIKIFFEE